MPRTIGPQELGVVEISQDGEQTWRVHTQFRHPALFEEAEGFALEWQGQSYNLARYRAKLYGPIDIRTADLAATCARLELEKTRLTSKVKELDTHIQDLLEQNKLLRAQIELTKGGDR